jgi:hypothetical protein
VIDAALRRVAGRLAAMQFDPSQTAALSREAWMQWRAWIAAGLQDLASGQSGLSPHPELENGTHTQALGRIARQIELIAGTISRIRA